MYKLPSLTFLDSRSVTETERKEAKRVGQFMKIVRPSEKEVGLIVSFCLSCVHNPSFHGSMGTLPICCQVNRSRNIPL